MSDTDTLIEDLSAQLDFARGEAKYWHTIATAQKQTIDYMSISAWQKFKRFVREAWEPTDFATNFLNRRRKK